MDEVKSYYNIYKINLDYANEFWNLEMDLNGDFDKSLVLNNIITNLEIMLRKKVLEGTPKFINTNDFKGILFKTKHVPEWKELMLKLFLDSNERSEDHLDDYICNTNISYILFYITQSNQLYALTGGYGSNYIRGVIEKNYGLNLIPKILKKDDPVVKKVNEYKLTGNNFSSTRTNRNNTNFYIEEEFSSIYKELNVQIDYIIAKELGIPYPEDDKEMKKINIISKDSIAIRKVFTIDEVKNIIIKLNEVEERKDNFVLNYLIPSTKANIKESELNEELIKRFNNMVYEPFLLVGDDLEKYYFDATEYQLLDENNYLVFSKKEPMILKEIFEIVLDDKKSSLSKVESIIKKYKISTKDEKGNILLYPQTMKECLQGFLEFKNQLFYLINGSWYVFNLVYEDKLDEEFEHLYENSKSESEEIRNKYMLKIDANNENDYNNKFVSHKKIIFSHTALLSNIEIADLIFWDDNTLYLMHNKNNFNGQGVRDLTNQIQMASTFIQTKLLNNKTEFLTKYYSRICEKNNVNEHPAISKDDFVKLFNKKICFVAGYLNGYSITSKSTYAKYLSFELYRILTSRNHKFLPLSIK